MAEDKRDKWWLRLRRSFGIADLITDEHAKTIIAERLLLKHDLDRDDAVTIVTDLIARFLGACATGEMDYMFLPDSQRKWIQPNSDPFVTVWHEVTTNMHISLASSSDKVEAMAKMLVESVAHSLDKCQFETAEGLYFN
jgi:hypothetical protein